MVWKFETEFLLQIVHSKQGTIYIKIIKTIDEPDDKLW